MKIVYNNAVYFQHVCIVGEYTNLIFYLINNKKASHNKQKWHNTHIQNLLLVCSVINNFKCNQNLNIWFNLSYLSLNEFINRLIGEGGVDLLVVTAGLGALPLRANKEDTPLLGVPLTGGVLTRLAVGVVLADADADAVAIEDVATWMLGSTCPLPAAARCILSKSPKQCDTYKSDIFD